MTKRKAGGIFVDAKLQKGIPAVPTGVPGFDAVLGGGLPECSFNLIVGNAGSGKTTLAQQFVFANASAKKRVLYFTVLGEPTLKMLRYQKQFDFFDASLLGTAVDYVNLSSEVLEQDWRRALELIVREVERVKPSIVVVDSFRTTHARRTDDAGANRMSPDDFIQHLALLLISWEITSLIIGDSDQNEPQNPAYGVADGVFCLSQVTDRNSVVRKLQVIKVRGRAPMPGLHTFRITGGGLRVFPRIPEQPAQRRPAATLRLTTGVPGLDEAMGGGIPAGDAVLLGGPAGSGKTTFATQFAAEGLRQGESVVIVVFEEYPEVYLARAKARNQDIGDMSEKDNFRLIYLRPLDLSVDETLAEILDAVHAIGATRVVIDSLSGFQIALAPAFREDFRESLYRLVGTLTASGVTMMMTTEITGGFAESSFTTERVSFITDDIIIQRFVEIEGVLRTVLAIPKMRGSSHSRDFLTYEITGLGAVVGGPLRNYRGILTGVPVRQPNDVRSSREGLTERESAVLATLVRLGGASRESLAEHVGVSEVEIAETIGRLALLGYARISRHGGQEMLQAIAQAEGGKQQ